jgi:transmembrane sensor
MRELDPPISDVLLDRYLAGYCDETERLVVEQWVDAVPERANRFATIHRLLDGEANGVPYVTARPQLFERISSAHPPAVTRNHSGTQGIRSPKWWAMAGISVVFVATLAMTVSRTSTSRDEATVLARYHTTAGQRATIRLNDGSTMVLAPATMATVTSTHIHLDGDASFDVIARPARPFIVTTRSAIVRVLGTRFRVRQYGDDVQSQVIVDAGKVGVRSTRNARETTVSSRMHAVVTDSTVAVTQRHDASDTWIAGQLMFERIPLQQVVHELSRAYGIRIQVSDTLLAQQRVTIEASVTTDPLITVLDDIAFVVNAHYVRADRGFVIVPGRASSRARPTRSSSQPEKQYGK